MIYLLFFKALAFTLIIEIALIGLITRKQRFIYPCFLVNLLTNPLLNLLLFLLVPALGNNYYYQLLIILELAVIISEGLLYAYMLAISKKAALGLSLLLNIISYFIGYFLL